MFSFTARKNASEVKGRLARICDLTSPNLAAPSYEDRAEDRYNRSIPTLICPWEHGKPCIDESVFVVTKDLSDIGLGMVTHQPIRASELLVALWPEEHTISEPWFFIGGVKRNTPMGGGFWILGVELTEFANPEHREVLGALIPLAKRLRMPTPICAGSLNGTL